MDRIEKTWFQLTEAVNADSEIAKKWLERLTQQQTAADRYYHNLNHVRHLLILIEEHKNEIECKEALQFAAFFHDYIYNAGSCNNERLSADVALNAMTELGVPKPIIGQTIQMILATKAHRPQTENRNEDLLLFLDMDMAILGASKQHYKDYTKAVELEFNSCPSFLYKRGRIGFLKQTLSQPFIFHTETFRNEYELKARRNLSEELKALGPTPSILDYRSIIHACVKHHSISELTY